MHILTASTIDTHNVTACCECDRMVQAKYWYGGLKVVSLSKNDPTNNFQFLTFLCSIICLLSYGTVLWSEYACKCCNTYPLFYSDIYTEEEMAETARFLAWCIRPPKLNSLLSVTARMQF